MKLIEKSYKIIMSYGEVQDVKGKVFQTMLLPKHSFGIRKMDKMYGVDHINSGRDLGIRAKTSDDALNKLIDLLRDKEKVAKIKSAPSMEDTKALLKRAESLVEEWEKITQINLPIFLSNCQIDMLSLDRKLVRPKEQSMSEYILLKWGERADKIVRELLDIEMKMINIQDKNIRWFDGFFE